MFVSDQNTKLKLVHTCDLWNFLGTPVKFHCYYFLFFYYWHFCTHKILKIPYIFMSDDHYNLWITSTIFYTLMIDIALIFTVVIIGFNFYINFIVYRTIWYNTSKWIITKILWVDIIISIYFVRSVVIIKLKNYQYIFMGFISTKSVLIVCPRWYKISLYRTKYLGTCYNTDNIINWIQ